MKIRTPLLLTLFFSGLIGLWLLERLRVPTAEQARAMTGRILPELIDVKPEAIARVEIDRGSDTIRLVRDRSGAGWRFASGTRGRADHERADALVRGLKALPRSATAATLQGPPESFGLDSPIVVRLFSEENDRTPIASLEVGRKNRDHRYVQAAGQSGVDLADANILAGVDGSESDWREREIFSIPSFQVATLESKGSRGRLRLVRTEGHLRIEDPIRAPADPTRADGLIAGLATLRVVDGAEGFVTAGDEKSADRFGLKSPSRTIRLTDSKGRSETLDVGLPEKEGSDRLYARRKGEDEVFLVPSGAFSPLDADPRELRGQKVADVVPERVDRLRISIGETIHDLRKTDGVWRVVAPTVAAGPADTLAIDLIVKGLATAQVSEYRTAKEAPPANGLDHPSMTVEAWETGDPSDAPGASLVLGKRDRGRKTLYARTAGDPDVMLLPDTSFEPPPPGPFGYRDRSILNLKPQRMTRLSVRKDGETLELVPSARPGDFERWRIDAPVPARADAENLAALDLLLSRMRAEGLVANADSASSEYGFETPFLEIQWSVVPETSVSMSDRTLKIGAEVPESKGSRYVTVSGVPFVFRLTARAIALLQAELRNRVVVAVPTDRVESITVVRGDRSTVYRRAPGSSSIRWLAISGQPTTADEPSQIGEIVTRLASLRATRFIQYRGPISRETGLESPTLRLEVALRDSPELVRLRLGAIRPDGQRYATTEVGRSGAVFLQDDTTGEPWRGLIGSSTPVKELPDDPFAKTPQATSGPR